MFCVASLKKPSNGVLCHNDFGFSILAHVPGEGPGLQLPNKNGGASLHWLTAVIWLGVVMSVPIPPFLHCKNKGRRIQYYWPHSNNTTITSVVLITTVQQSRNSFNPLNPVVI